MNGEKEISIMDFLQKTGIDLSKIGKICLTLKDEDDRSIGNYTFNLKGQQIKISSSNFIFHKSANVGNIADERKKSVITIQIEKKK